MVVFLPNGVYFEATDSSTGEPRDQDGIEHGTYAWNPATGVLTSSRRPAPYVDTNGRSGLSDADGSGLTFTFRVSADGLTLTGTVGAAPFSLERVGGVASGPTTTDVVEYFNAGFDHYFMTAQADEIAGLDGGAYGGAFVRTGRSFKVGERRPRARCRCAASSPRRACSALRARTSTRRTRPSARS